MNDLQYRFAPHNASSYKSLRWHWTTIVLGVRSSVCVWGSERLQLMSLESQPAGWTCESASCFCWEWRAACLHLHHCWPRMDACASCPPQSIGSQSSSSISFSPLTAPLRRYFTRSLKQHHKMEDRNQLVQVLCNVCTSGALFRYNTTKANQTRNGMLHSEI